MDGKVFYSWSAQEQLNPVEVVTGEGATFTDAQGKSYLDFSSQLVYLNLGHQHPRLIQAIKDQADTLTTIQPAFKNSTRDELARLIIEAAPGERYSSVFFTNGGAEATENAVRMARAYTGRRKVMSAYRSYHGATPTAIDLTGEPRRWKNEPTDAGVLHFFGPYAYRSPFWSSSESEECERALAHLEQQIILEGADTIAALIMETVVGTNGVLVPPKGYLPGVRALCDKYGIVYIADEVMVGFGRTGTMFAVENFDVEPDLITFAKGVNSGYVPLGGVIMSREIAKTWDEIPYHGGLTYSGHPMGCAPGVETFAVFEEEKILERTRDLGERVVRPRLEAMKEKYKVIGDVRGLGLFWAIEFVKDRETREPLVPFNAKGDAAAPMNAFAAYCKENGVWPMVNANRAHVAPPLIITEEDLNRGLDVYEQAIAQL
ncbi:aminotransferase class III-fold pyridoxal phosphate-dependent enzyme [Corynebacterium breve]|uniref:Aminotransferase class III-fold pyridoxal phosphate-dependent enzyme n=1 Tax=Corynebacterium breve TaxID=3049799 RepID=A0ABY8VCT7_9CORY|nr:aminotransferase class III-fold pyridoxal phosphate-dependent enzyme [Corynebacterium breve]WIM67479.1 aminotransferase class III-fold pyridoxal phosphate-dependent enzyme [Corynebacterium breve]